MNSTSVYVDELSGVYNRRYLKEEGEKAIQRYFAKHVAFSIVIVDIDHFKEINDIHGHLKGDEIIRDFAHYLRDALRKTDTVIRYGGDEFLCLMPRAMRHDAEVVYRRILKGVRERAFSGLSITLSVGIASYPRDGADFEGLFRAADQALYDAKRGGRDRIGVVRRKKVELPMRVFIDRCEERDALRAVLSNGAALRIALVKGRVGIGKTRLSKEALETIKGKEIIWTDCLLLGESIAYYPLREAIKYRLQRIGSGVFKDIPLVYRLEVSKLIPEMMEGVAEPVSIDAVLDKYRLYEGIRQVIEAGDRPKVMVIDNIQWIDQESIEVLMYVIRALRSHPLTLVFIYRSEEATDFLEEFLSSVSRDIAVQEISLNQFGPKDVRECVRAIIGEEPEPRLAAYVMETSGGIPFYIEELMRGLVERRCLDVEDDVWIFRPPDEEVVPRSLADIAMRKYRGVSKEAQQVVDIASVIGRFDVGVLVSLTGYNEGHVMGLINEVSRLGMVRYVKDRFEFSEEMSRQALYQRNVSGLKGLTLHRCVAEELVKIGADVEELALHCYRGQEHERGVQYCVEAGDKAAQKYAHRDALRYYTWALDMLKDEQSVDKTQIRIDCLFKRIGIYHRIGENEHALQDLEQCVKESQILHDKDRLGTALLTRADVYHHTSQYRESIIDAENGVRIFREIGDQRKLAQTLHAMAFSYFRLTDYNKALQYGEEALKTVQGIDATAERGNLLNFMGIVHRALGHNHKALEYYKESNRICEEHGLLIGMSSSLSNIGLIYRIIGEYTNALKYYNDSLKIDKEIGDRHGEAIVYINIGNLYCDIGDYHASLQYLKDSLKIRRDIGDKTGEALCLVNMGDVYVRMSDYAEAQAQFEQSLSIARTIEDKRCEVGNRTGIAAVHLYTGDYDKARTTLESVITMARTLHFDSEEFFVLLLLADLDMTLHDLVSARNHVERASTIAETFGSHIMVRDYLYTAAELHLEEGDDTAFQKIIDDMGRIPEEVKTKRFQGEMNLLVGRYYLAKKDFKKAATYVQHALATFEALGEKLNSGRAYYYRSMIEFGTGNRIGANNALCKAQEIFASINAQGWYKEATALLGT